jgi:hypothetical protein
MLKAKKFENPPQLSVSAKIPPYLEQGIKTHIKVFVGSFVGRRGSQNPYLIF